LLALAYVRVATSDLGAARRFGQEILGLETVAMRGAVEAFRSDSRFCSLVFDESDEGQAVGVCVDDDALDPLAVRLSENGFRCQLADRAFLDDRSVHRAVVTADGSGNRIELVTRPLVASRRYIPSRECGVASLQGVGLRSIDVERDVFFWSLMGARVSDRVGGISYIAIDEEHHRIAQYPSDRPGLLNVAFEVDSIDSVMRNYYFACSRQVKVAQGPGRETASSQAFLHIVGPEEILFSFVTGMRRFDPLKDRPRQFARTRESLCSWGSECVCVPELSPRVERTSQTPEGTRR
jgi:2,3-dihydroxy-p-cumate/2,3-dihydroxybenzoate 3,4-dioxygenase